MPGLLAQSIGVTDANGGLQLRIPLPAAKAALGVQFTTQMMIVRTGGPLLGVGELTNGVELTLGL